MRLLFVADGRSPIALNWMAYFVDQGYEVHLASTYSSDPNLDLASVNFVSVAFSRVKTSNFEDETGYPLGGFFWSSSFVNVRTSLRRYLAPFTLSSASQNLWGLIEKIHPDIVHAMRIPYEGMLAAKALLDKPELPLLISVWGNDFTLHANATSQMASLTRQVLKRADGLHTDCQRDLRLAHQWGYSEDRPAVVLPGNGGVQIEWFYPSEEEFKTNGYKVVNPRGFRSYIRNDTFFNAIPIVLAEHPDTMFVCPDMAGETQAQRWISELKIGSAVDLLPKVPRSEMAKIFRSAVVAVSPSVHDGIPNTLLEAMACGCFPIAGDLESLREWIEPGINGLLVDPTDPNALGEAINTVLDQPVLRKKAFRRNQELIEKRARYAKVMESALTFYRSFLND
jgi:glycosyltransferase involved in cell wall biosynthesis